MVSRRRALRVCMAAGLSVAAAADPGAIRVPRVEASPQVDCQTDDAAWSQAAILDGFRQTNPGDNSDPAHPTEVRLVYTEQALFVAITAFDDPAHVRATLARRDQISADDSVSLYLDTFHDRRRAYLLTVNPRGVQQDGMFVEGSEPDISFDLDFESAGCLTDDGYSVELRVPFASLRYRAGAGQVWGLHVIRTLQHEAEENSWRPLRRDRIGVAASTRELRARFLAQAGTLRGLEAARHERTVEWLPVASTSRTEDGSTSVALGGTARVALAPALAADVALWPHFAEVEADQPQSGANQRFPLFFAEKRPFFLEGADLFRTPVRAFHSRTLLDPDAAVKLTGTRGGMSATALFAVDAPGEAERAFAAVGRARRDIGLQSSLGLLATLRRQDGHGNAVFGVDGRLVLGVRAVWTVQALVSHSPAGGLGAEEFRSRRSPHGTSDGLRPALEPDGVGLAYFSEWARSDRRTSVQLVGEGYSPDYQADLGYTQRRDTHRWSLVTRYNGSPRTGGPLVRWSAVHTAYLQFDWGGRTQFAYLYPRLLLTFPRQTSLNLYAYSDYVRVFEHEFGAAFAGRPERSTRYHGYTVEATTAPHRAIAASLLLDRSWNNLDYDLGAGRFPRASPLGHANPRAPLDPGSADATSLVATLSLQPAPALSVSASHERHRMTRDDTGLPVYVQRLTSLRAQLAFSRAAWLRARLDHDSLDGRVLHQLVFGWTPRPGTAIYAGYDEAGRWRGVAASGYARERRTLFAKVAWGLRSGLTRARAAERPEPTLSGRGAASDAP